CRPRDRGGRHGGAGREHDQLRPLGRVAPQVDDAGQELEVVHAVGLPAFVGLHVDRAAVPRHLHPAGHGRQHDLACQAADGPGAPSASPPPPPPPPPPPLPPHPLPPHPPRRPAPPPR